MKITIQQIAERFNCTPAQVGAQFAKNYAGIKGMYVKACATRKKVNGYTSEQLRQIMNSMPMGN